MEYTMIFGNFFLKAIVAIFFDHAIELEEG